MPNRFFTPGHSKRQLNVSEGPRAATVRVLTFNGDVLSYQANGDSGTVIVKEATVQKLYVYDFKKLTVTSQRAI